MRQAHKPQTHELLPL